MLIRPLRSEAELLRVAQGMRETLIEVEGETVGGAMYSMDWLLARARQHWLAEHWPATVLLACEGKEQLGHSLLREDPFGDGLVSTTWVWPTARRRGVAAALLAAGEAWMGERGLAHSATWTSASNSPLIQLYTRRGYQIVDRQIHQGTGTPMLQLRRTLRP